MRRYGLSFFMILVASLVSVGFAGRAEALNHVKALRTGQLVIAVANPPVSIPSQSGASSTSGSSSDILPVLLGSPHSPSDVKAYSEAMRKLLSPTDSALLKPYREAIQGLHVAQTFLSSAQQVVSNVPWIKNSSNVMLYRGTEPMNAQTMHALTFHSGKDAIVFVRPIVVFSSDMEQVYVIARVTVYASGPVHAFFMGSTTLYARVLLNDTGPELRNYGAEGLAASEQIGPSVVHARASVWFAHDASRLKQAFVKDVQNLQAPLSSYLRGSS